MRTGEQKPRFIPTVIDKDAVSPSSIDVQPSEADTETVAPSEEELSRLNTRIETEIVEPTQQESSAVVQPVGLTLRAEVLSDTWLKVLADGDDLYEGIMKIGATATWRADSLFELKIGKAKGVRLVLNGQPLGELGDPDKVVSKLVLDKNGIVTKILR